jgi:hypothetical protein
MNTVLPTLRTVLLIHMACFWTVNVATSQRFSPGSVGAATCHSSGQQTQLYCDSLHSDITPRHSLTEWHPVIIINIKRARGRGATQAQGQ